MKNTVLCHKGRNYSTVTFVAPVVLNGERGNMAVVVKRTSDNFYKMHRILSPDGKMFIISENKRTELTPAGALSHKDTHAAPISSVSNTTVAQSQQGVNNQSMQKKVQYSIDLSFAAEYDKWDKKKVQVDISSLARLRKRCNQSVFILQRYFGINPK